MSEQQGRTDCGHFTHGNNVWRLRRKLGAPRVFEDALSLWEACCDYFEWSTQNPLFEAKALADGAIIPISKLRAFTQRALCVHLQISDETWRIWRSERDDLKDVIATVDAIIYSQKFEGAAAGLLNAGLIARELGISDKKEVTGADGGPLETGAASNLELARAVAAILGRGIVSGRQAGAEDAT